MIVWIQLFFLLLLALGVLLIPLSDSKRRYFILIGSFINLVLSLRLFLQIPADGSSLALIQGAPSDLFLANYVVAIDSISCLFVLLNAAALLVTIMGTWKLVTFNNKLHCFIVLLLAFFLNQLFLTVSLTTFYVMSEITMLLGLMLIVVFLGEKRVIPFRVFLLPVVASIFMFIVVASLGIGAYSQFGDFSLTVSRLLSLDFSANGHLFSKSIVFWFLLFAILLKMQIVPLHSSVMKISIKAPVSARLMFIPVFNLVAFYGIFRFVYPLFQNMLNEYRLVFVLCLLGGMIYSVLLMLRQRRMAKKISFFSHGASCLIMMGILVGNKSSYTGALFYLFSCTFVVMGLWLLDYYLERDQSSVYQSTVFAKGQVIKKLNIASCLVLMLASVGLPATSEFAGKVFIINGVMSYDLWIAVGCILGLLLSSICLLSSLKKIICYESDEFFLKLGAMHFWEIMPVFVVILCVTLLGLFPDVLMKLLV